MNVCATLRFVKSYRLTFLRFLSLSLSLSLSTSNPGKLTILVPPTCMTYEDFYAAFSKDSHPSLSVSPVTGRMDRRGGEPTELDIICNPQGQGGEFKGTLVINLPEDNSKICYKVTARAF